MKCLKIEREMDPVRDENKTVRSLLGSMSGVFGHPVGFPHPPFTTPRSGPAERDELRRRERPLRGGGSDMDPEGGKRLQS